MFRNPRLMTLFFTMLVVMIGFGIIIPIMPFYVQHFGKGGTEMGAMMAVFSIAQFISSPFWGNLSDRVGRKKILMVGVLGNAISLLVIGLADSFWVMFAARAVEGLVSSATFPTATAYISDSTTSEERGGGMGVIGAAMGMGMVIGPGLGGLVSTGNLSTPFFLASAMGIISLVMIYFVLPESLPPEKRGQAHGSAASASPRAIVQALFCPLGFLLFLAFLVNFALASFEGIFGLYTNARYNYGPAQVGSILMLIGIVTSLVQMLLTGPATRRYGESLVIKVSLIASAAGFLLMELAGTTFGVVTTVGFFVFATAMLRPAIMSLTSKMAQGGQGRALGMNNSFQSLGRTAGPLWAGYTFDINPIYPYLSGALILFFTFLYSLAKLPASRAPVEQPAAD